MIPNLLEDGFPIEGYERFPVIPFPSTNNRSAGGHPAKVLDSMLTCAEDRKFRQSSSYIIDTCGIWWRSECRIKRIRFERQCSSGTRLERIAGRSGWSIADRESVSQELDALPKKSQDDIP